MIQPADLLIYWTDKELLSRACLTIVEEQLELARLIASEESNLNTTYMSEREDMYKGTDSLAKAKAKALVGTEKTKHEYEFQALSNLLTVVISRMAQLAGDTYQTQFRQ